MFGEVVYVGQEVQCVGVVGFMLLCCVGGFVELGFVFVVQVVVVVVIGCVMFGGVGVWNVFVFEIEEGIVVL